MKKMSRAKIFWAAVGLAVVSKPSMMHGGSINSATSGSQVMCDSRIDPFSYVKPDSCTSAVRANILDRCYFVVLKQPAGACNWQSCGGVSLVGKLPVYNATAKTVTEYGTAVSVGSSPSPVMSNGTIRPLDLSIWPRAYLTVREAICLRKHFCSTSARAPYDAHRAKLCSLNSDKFPLNPYMNCATITDIDCSSLAGTLSPSNVLVQPVLTADKLVEQVYRGVAFGKSDPAGKKYWVDRFVSSTTSDKGTCISTAFAMFSGDAERAVVGYKSRDIVAGWYRGFLDRDPDEGGLTYWSSFLPLQFPSDEQFRSVKASFLEQPEFRKRCDAVCRPQSFLRGATIIPNTTYYSSTCNTVHRMLLGSDGALTVYRPNNTVLWTTGATSAVKAIFQTDGNLVLYNAAGQAVWASNTGGSTASKLVFREGGRLSLESPDGVEIKVVTPGEGRTL